MRLKIVYVALLTTAVFAIAGFWFWQQNAFSTGDVKLEILAPEQVTMGEEFTYVVKWKNVGESRLENATLVFEYPEGALPSEGGELRQTRQVDDINPGQETSIRFAGRLFGKQDAMKEAKAFLTYTPRNLNASFRSETSATSKISSVPLNFELAVPSRTEAGQQLELTMNYFSNSEYPLSDLRIQMEYPEGFSFKGASPSPLGETEWDVGVLNHTEGGRISVQGTLQGSVQEVKMFRAVIGSWKDGKFTVLREGTKAVQITRPQLLITQAINSSPNYAASLGDVLHYEVFFRNPTDKILENLFLVVSFEGRAFDLESIKVESGRFQKGDNSIVWEAQDVSKLRFLGRGEEGKVEFWVNVKEDVETFSPQDKKLVLKNRVLLSEVSAEFELKLNAALTIDQKGFFEDDVFGNEGSAPPRVGQRNTYTIIWRPKNRYNDAENVRVKAELPAGVELTGKIFPEDSTFTFDSASREVVWEVGDLAAGTGVFDEFPAPSIAFQIAFTPSLSHRGKSAELIGEARVTGEDVFTDQVVSSTDEAIDTTLPDDPSVSEKDGVVR